MHVPALLIALGTLAMAVDQPDFVPPADAGVVNVKNFGATGDGTTDDTEAIRRAISENIDRSRYAAPPFIYLPAGIYRISAPLEGRQYKDLKGWSSGWRAGFLLVGQARTKSVLRLADKAEGYGDATKPKWVVATGSEADGPNEGGGGNRAFRHAVMNLTIDVGAGNPGAVAVDFVANNRGTVENVLLTAPDGSGRTGLCLDRWWPGPALIKDVEVRGFDQGVTMAGHWQYSMTFDGLVLKDQREIAFWADHNPAFIRRAKVSGTVTAFQVRANDGLLVLHDSSISGSASAPALDLKGITNLRNLTITGSATAVTCRGVGVAGDRAKPVTIAEWYQWQDDNAKPAGAATMKALKLPVEETPTYWPRASSEWINGAIDPQAAVDSGSPVVYFPNGSYDLKDTLILRGKVRKLIGFQSSLKAPKGKPAIRIEDTDQPVVLEHLWIEGGIDHVGRNAAAFRHVDFNHLDGSGQGLTASGPGKTFIEDVIGRYTVRTGHRLWARQTNAEFGKGPLLRNEGGTVWLFGYKTEADPGTISLLQTAGSTEVLGAILYPLHDMRPTTPAWQVDSGRFSGTWVYNSKNYHVHVRQAGKDHTGNWGRGPALWATE